MRNGGERSRSEINHSLTLRTELYRVSGIDFTEDTGPRSTYRKDDPYPRPALTPEHSPPEKHFISWLALCPNNRVTEGNIKSTKTRKTANRAAYAFRMGAQSLANRPASEGFYRLIRVRLGAPKAITATAHKLARIFYRMLTTGQSSTDLGSEYYENHYKERVLRFFYSRRGSFCLRGSSTQRKAVTKPCSTP